MKKLTIVWDFDGTILPHAPYDSEQSLLIHAMHRQQKPLGWLKKIYARAMIYADQHERLRKAFKMSYIRLLKGTPSAVLDEVCRHLTEKISTADRSVLRTLSEDGYDMMVLSCGTADLSERVLRFAGLLDCFSLIEGNRFRFADDRIAGMELRLPDPADKLQIIQRLNLSPDHTVVVGDGYTDLPLLNWSAIPVIIDRSGKKKKRFTSHNFYFISSIPKIMHIIEEHVT
ncbi:MAG: haloacid dehalogenase-like hydrolase [Deltaproteobacteria bacterium]|jgi:phosphoserine phosphatase|nr:haloacid dehalogenase-like hydrolase [Deltaproteobacteria bacterium]